jgi:hypothetical protein
MRLYSQLMVISLERTIITELAVFVRSNMDYSFLCRRGWHNSKWCTRIHSRWHILPLISIHTEIQLQAYASCHIVGLTFD